MSAAPLDPRACELGEGAFWHPLRQQFYWFDILNRRLLTRAPDGTPRDFTFAQMVSAMGWVSADEAVVACERGLLLLDLNSGAHRPLIEAPAGQPATRSNDGRADRQGGFWWGTMGKRGGEDHGLGAIWRYYRGELRQILPGITIPNAICFSPDGRVAHFADTVEQKVWQLDLDAQGWPAGRPRLYLDLSAQGLFPDGAVICEKGLFWNAQWGASRVAAYAPDGSLVTSVPIGAPQCSCPAFGGPGLDLLHVTTAREGLSPEELAAFPLSGQVFTALNVGRGLPEPRVVL